MQIEVVLLWIFFPLYCSILLSEYSYIESPAKFAGLGCSFLPVLTGNIFRCASEGVDNEFLPAFGLQA